MTVNKPEKPTARQAGRPLWQLYNSPLWQKETETDTEQRRQIPAGQTDRDWHRQDR